MNLPQLLTARSAGLVSGTFRNVKLKATRRDQNTEHLAEEKP